MREREREKRRAFLLLRVPQAIFDNRRRSQVKRGRGHLCESFVLLTERAFCTRQLMSRDDDGGCGPTSVWLMAGFVYFELADHLGYMPAVACIYIYILSGTNTAGFAWARASA